MTSAECWQLIRLVQGLWPTAQLGGNSESLIDAWMLVLNDVDFHDAAMLVRVRAIDEQPFPPPPGTIAATVHAAYDRALGIAAPDVDQAWTEVARAVATRGLMAGPPEWSHPAIDAAAKAITWRELCLSNNVDTVRAHFLRMYAAATARIAAERREQPELTGGTVVALPRHTPRVE